MHAPQTPNTTTLGAQSDKFDAQDILSLLPSLGYKAVMSAGTGASADDIQTPLYFTSAKMVVFPPSTDNPENNLSKLKGIEYNMDRAIAGNHTRLLDKDLIFFPVFEEWQPSIGFSSEPRQHWVLLVYLKTKETVYLLDAMGSVRSEAYYGPKKRLF